ncbi:MAG: MATE family efflux transporter [Ectothiorhodospiraceae bacterium]|nr:MATE family efflux transporter [Ectothiorhodospiraceae bacterium]
MTTDDLTRESMGRTLFRMTWPMLFGVTSLLGFQLVDSAFIGQLGLDPLAALGFTIPVAQLMIGMQVGLGVATTAIIARALGAGEAERARRLATLVFVTGAVGMLLLALLLWLGRGLITQMLGAQSSLMPLISAYWAPWLLSAWIGALLYFCYSIARANGDTRLPGLLMVVTSLINLALDPLFIFTFGWGMAGAAWATVVAFGTGLVIILPRLLRRHWIAVDLAGLDPRPALRQLGAIAGPATLSQLLPPVSAMLATYLVAGFGSAAVAAWGLGTRLEFFSIVVVLALTMSVPPMASRLLGAGDLERIRQLVGLSIRFILLWHLAIAALWLLLSAPLSQLLSEDVGVAALLREYLLRVPLSYGALGVCMLMVSVCNALGLPLKALLAAGARLFLCYLPALWLGAELAGMTGLYTGALLGNMAAGLLAWTIYRRGMALLEQESGATATSTAKG